jgi:hypothetical protein
VESNHNSVHQPIPQHQHNIVGNTNFETKISSKIVVCNMKVLDKINALSKGKTSVDWHER